MDTVTDSTKRRQGGTGSTGALLHRGHIFFIERHGWIYLLIAALWCGATAYVLTQQQVALPEKDARPRHPPGAGLALSTPPKQITYEVTSSTNSDITVSYLDEHGQAQRFTGRGPWRESMTVTDVVSLAGITALATDATVSCMITVDGKVAAQQSQTGGSPSVTCNLNAFPQPPQ